MDVSTTKDTIATLKYYKISTRSQLTKIWEVATMDALNDGVGPY